MYKRKAFTTYSTINPASLEDEETNKIDYRIHHSMFPQPTNIIHDLSVVSDINLLKNTNKFSEIYKKDEYAAGVTSEIYCNEIFADKPDLQEK